MYWHELFIRFPKSQRFTLGERCSNYLLHTLEQSIASAGISDREKKKTHLQSASAKLDMLKLLVRLAKDCQCISNEQYLTMESHLHQAGKMLGGWIKSIS